MNVNETSFHSNLIRQKDIRRISWAKKEQQQQQKELVERWVSVFFYRIGANTLNCVVDFGIVFIGFQCRQLNKCAWSVSLGNAIKWPAYFSSLLVNYKQSKRASVVLCDCLQIANNWTSVWRKTSRLHFKTEDMCKFHNSPGKFWFSKWANCKWHA